LSFRETYYVVLITTVYSLSVVLLYQFSNILILDVYIYDKFVDTQYRDIFIETSTYPTANSFMMN